MLFVMSFSCQSNCSVADVKSASFFVVFWFSAGLLEFCSFDFLHQAAAQTHGLPAAGPSAASGCPGPPSIGSRGISIAIFVRYLIEKVDDRKECSQGTHTSNTQYHNHSLFLTYQQIPVYIPVMGTLVSTSTSTFHHRVTKHRNSKDTR